MTCRDHQAVTKYLPHTMKLEEQQENKDKDKDKGKENTVGDLKTKIKNGEKRAIIA